MKIQDFLSKYEIDKNHTFSNLTLFDVLYSNIVFHRNGIMLITDEKNVSLINTSITQVFRNTGLSRNQLMIIQNLNDELNYVYASGYKQPIEDLYVAFNDLMKNEDIKDEFLEEKKTIENIDHVMEDIRNLSLKIANGNSRIKEYEDGTVMINTNKGWMKASNKNTLEEFKKVLFFGFFGGNKFMENKIWQGLFYLVTGGLFCLGYIEDLIPFFCDTKVDEDGNPYIPLSKEQKKQYLLPFLVMVGLNIGYCAFILFILKNFRL